jgi:hypothetical protein
VLDKPYQATIVETIGQAPLPPVTVNFHSSQIGNNLMIDPPRNSGGQQIQRAAKQAAEKTGDSDRSENTREAQQATQNQNTQVNEAQRRDSEAAALRAENIANILEDSGIKITTADTNDKVYRRYQDQSNTRQIGWGYEALSPSGYNYANIALPITSRALVVVTQDRLTDAFNSNTESARSYGTIIINQQHR